MRVFSGFWEIVGEQEITLDGECFCTTLVKNDTFFGTCITAKVNIDLVQIAPRCEKMLGNSSSISLSGLCIFEFQHNLFVDGFAASTGLKSLWPRPVFSI